MTAKANVFRIIGHFPDNIHFTEDSRTKRSNCIEIVEMTKKCHFPRSICQFLFAVKNAYIHTIVARAQVRSRRGPPYWGITTRHGGQIK